MSSEETAGGISQLLKVALPRVGQVGAVASGLIGLLVALEKLSGEIVTALEGIVLLMAIVASATVIWGHSSKTVDGHSVSLPLYSRRTRRAAVVVLAVLGVLTLFFAAQVANAFLHDQTSDQAVAAGRATPRPGLQQTRTAERATQGANVVGTPSGTALPDVRQVNDIRTLTTMGFQAIASKEIMRALVIFSRALQVDATSSLAQLGYGESLYFDAQYANAITPLKTALQLNANLSDAHAYLGFAYAATKDSVRARAEFDEFLRVAQNDSDLRPLVNVASKQLPNVTPIAPPLRATPVPTR